ncbi:MAG: hypothetical protein LBM23_10520 [Propionibacteriaceae bacterium]|jgi:hypothetical protein|nr:hypothetical protein [Propionibacteriaceae bacterium]
MTRLRRVVTVAIALILGVVLGISGDISLALWQRTTDIGGPQVGWDGFAVTRGATTIAYDPATGADPTITLTASDAEALVEAREAGIGLPFTVQSRADGSAGLSYTVALPQFPAGGVFARADVALYRLSQETNPPASSETAEPTEPEETGGPVTDATAPACAPPTGATPVLTNEGPTSAEVVGLAPTYAPIKTATDQWCLVAVLTDEVYENTASVVATGPLGATVTNADQTDGTNRWRTDVAADATDEGDHVMIFTHTITTATS